MKEAEPIVKMAHKGKILYRENPMKFLLENGMAVQVGNGLFVLKGLLVKILDRIESLICKIADEVGAEHVSVPYILSWENSQKSHYLDSFKNQALMITPFEKTEEGGDNLPHLGLACPTVCYHYFSSLKNKSVDRNHAITAIARCTRKEKGNLNNLSRLTNFTMREIIFFGTEDYCSRKIKEVLNKTTEMLNSVFDLSYEVLTASDPFFGESAEVKKQAQLISESKYELQTLLPFNDTTISIGSFNNHGKVFYDRFNITSGKSELTYSGCVGWGYERILYAILSQKGIDFSSPYYRKLLG